MPRVEALSAIEQIARTFRLTNWFSDPPPVTLVSPLDASSNTLDADQISYLVQVRRLPLVAVSITISLLVFCEISATFDLRLQCASGNLCLLPSALFSSVTDHSKMSLV